MAFDATDSINSRASASGSEPDVEFPALVWYVDAARGAYDFNDAWRRLAGVAEEDLSADGWLEFIHPDDATKFAFLRDPSFAAAPCSLDVRIRDETSRYRWFLVSCGGPSPSSRRALVALSIEERKSAELETELELDNVRAMLDNAPRSEEHTSELQSLMRISYAVFCLKKKNNKHDN